MCPQVLSLQLGRECFVLLWVVLKHVTLELAGLTDVEIVPGKDIWETKGASIADLFYCWLSISNTLVLVKYIYILIRY